MNFWANCLAALSREYSPQQISLWIKTLSVVDNARQGGEVRLLAPNWTTLQWVRERYKISIEKLAAAHYGREVSVILGISRGNSQAHPQVHPSDISQKFIPIPAEQPSSPPPPAPLLLYRAPRKMKVPLEESAAAPAKEAPNPFKGEHYEKSRLNPDFTFDNLVTGEGNGMARASAIQVARQPGESNYNPLFIYGGVGLGKTHILHAIGNHIFGLFPEKTIRYIHTEDYVADVVRTCQQKSFDSFKHYYRSCDVLLIDDIQFLRGKERTQEEFFYTFNALLDGKKQMIITCDTPPKEMAGLDVRLVSRFDWGLTVHIEPPELAMRIAILHKKAEREKITLNQDVAFLIAESLRSNVRELEGALKKVVAFAKFHRAPTITVDLCQEALKDIFRAHRRQITLSLIKKTVADYYKVDTKDLISKKRTRSITRPRQMAMWLAKELTNTSLPAIGESFGGRDHTTVLHAYRLVSQLRQQDPRLNEDLDLLSKALRG